MSLALSAIRAQYARIRRARLRLHGLIYQGLPVGTPIHYRHGNQVRAATVLAHGYDDELQVQGPTGKTYWITADRVVVVFV